MIYEYNTTKMKKYVILPLICMTLTMQAQETYTVGNSNTLTDVPELQLQQARSFLDEHNYEMAAKLLREVQSGNCSSIQQREAAAMLAIIAYYQDAASAASTITKYINEYPDTPELNRMKALILLSHYAQEDYAAVIQDMGEIDPDMLNDKERDDVVLAYALSMIQE